MIILLCLWLGVAVLEGLLYFKIRLVYPGQHWWRLALIGGVAIAYLAVSVSLVVNDWRIWIVPSLIGLYRFCNLARLYVRRLPSIQLHRVSLRAHGWLVSAQLVLAGTGWLVARHNWAHIGYATLAGLQILVSVGLLRITLRTWRHTQPPATIPPLVDTQLPSLSVLIPARNETTALEACLDSLIASNYPKLEIIVVDDCSANRRTPEIIRTYAQHGVRFIQGTAPDETRWLAKNWAYDQLRSEASGELLLFSGVDVLLAPGSLRQLVELLEVRHKDMLSLLPLRTVDSTSTFSLLQTMRYFWELCLPRRMFKRPPVLSTCWLIRANTLDMAGGFAAVSRSISPEAHFARAAVVSDKYSFLRSDEQIAIQSTKPTIEQYQTTVRTRYPQLHRRLELVAVAAVFELFFLLGPFVGFILGVVLGSMGYIIVYAVATVAVIGTYYTVAVETRLNSPLLGLLLAPLAVSLDTIMLHTSMIKYEFSTVEWKGRNVCIPVMQVEAHLPKL